MIGLLKTEVVYYTHESAIILELEIGQQFHNSVNNYIWEVDDIVQCGDKPDDILVSFSNLTTDVGRQTANMKYIRQRLTFGDKYLSLV